MDAEHKKLLRALSLEIRHTLEGQYDAKGCWQAGDLERRLNELGVWRDRAPKPLAELPQLSPADRHARRVVDTFLEVRREVEVGQAEGIAEFVRESAYTWANRLLALRCMEARGIIDEVIVQKDIYGGRSLKHHRFARKFPQRCTAADDGLFEVLLAEFEERAGELPALFRPNAPAVVLRPSVAALKRCVALLSGAEALRGHKPATDELFEAPDTLGWAYQYWNAQEKDRVFEFLRTSKGAKVEGPDIIPATQLYTESYMVKFLVQNSLGALWMQMHPDSVLADGWEHFVREADRVPDRKRRVAEITVLDPACGSGHFLLEAFDLLYQMYEEEGEVSSPQDIVTSILNKNLYGVDIDERAVQIAILALFTKARERAPELDPRSCRRLTDHLIATNIRIPHSRNHLESFLERHPEDLPLRSALEIVFRGLENVDQLGTLVQIERPVAHELDSLQRRLPLLYGLEEGHFWKAKLMEQLREHFALEATATDDAHEFFSEAAGKGLALFTLLSRQYDVVVANPPYMGAQNMGATVKSYLAEHYPEGKGDLYAAFLMRCLDLAGPDQRVAMVTQESWMFLKSFSDLRATASTGSPDRYEKNFVGVLRQTSIEVIAHLGPRAFAELTGEVVSVALFVLANREALPQHRLMAFRLVGPKTPQDKEALLRSAILEPSAITSNQVQMDLLKVPESPVIYWLSDKLLQLLTTGTRVRDVCRISMGVGSRNELRFLRYDWELPIGDLGSTTGWVGYAKGGGYSKWYGFERYRIDWREGGARIRLSLAEKYLYLKGNVSFLIRDVDLHFQPGLSYSDVAGGSMGARVMSGGLCSDEGPGVYPDSATALSIAAVLNAHVSSYLLRALTPNPMHLRKGYVYELPFRSVGDTIAAWCLAAQVWLNSHNPTERVFAVNCYTAPERGDELGDLAVMAVKCVAEGVVDNHVNRAFELDASDTDRVMADTGTPAGWLPILAGYDALPVMPADVACIPKEVLEFIAEQNRLQVSQDQLAELKNRLHTLYENGPGTKVDASEVIPWVDSDGDEEEGALAMAGARIPIPPNSFLEELAAGLGINPVSVYWLLREGREQHQLRCLSEDKRKLEDRITILVLRLFGHRWPQEVHLQDPVVEDGIILLTHIPGRRTLLEMVRDAIPREFAGRSAVEVEREFQGIIGCSLAGWLSERLFLKHVSQFRRRPVLWQVQSQRRAGRRNRTVIHPSAFACLIYVHGVNEDTLPKLLNQYVTPLRHSYETEIRTLESLGAGSEERAVLLSERIEELRDFESRLAQVVQGGFSCSRVLEVARAEPLDKWSARTAGGPLPRDTEAFLAQERRYDPNPNDGVRVNVAPLQRAGLLADEVLHRKDVDKAIANRANWRTDERRWCREGRLPLLGWWRPALWDARKE